mmetsp:Transcript_25863/g.65191  ORF Transcript_25863/g.65191 Transcript_25863/m.65191 type:complete len:118 (+) Transcript_25863:455-808(+)
MTRMVEQVAAPLPTDDSTRPHPNSGSSPESGTIATVLPNSRGEAAPVLRERTMIPAGVGGVGEKGRGEQRRQSSKGAGSTFRGGRRWSLTQDSGEGETRRTPPATGGSSVRRRKENR